MLIFFWVNDAGAPPPPAPTATGAHGGMIVNAGRLLTRLLLVAVMTGLT